MKHPLVAAHPVRLVLILGSLSAFGPLSIDMYLPAFPSLAADLHAGPSAVQLTLTACLVGLASGQLLVGPLSDTLGRRRPLLVGLTCYTVLSAACLVAPSIWALAGLRLLQGFGGSAGLVIATAAVRDRYAGVAMARFLSTLMLVNGLAPILAPIVGGQLLRFTSWRGVFVVLTGVGLVLLVACLVWFEESLPPQRRRPGSLPDTARAYARLLRDSHFTGYAFAGGLAFAAMFSYISGSSFVLQDIFGLTPQQFGLVFGTNALGIVVVGQLNRWLVARHSPRSLLFAGLGAATAGGVLLVVAVLAGWGLPALLPGLFAVVASIGIVLPNTRALATVDYPDLAGTSSALLGVAQFAVGGLVAPLIGVGGTGTAVPMVVVIAALTVLALVVFVVFTRSRDR
ncbi:MAG TPA: Bcr/CflA family multidrug efflux MFS transporter [Pseudonocardiaceae bacterium]|jgi:DHA1 family bicyclomycin/chloramphenicol resistance-like MFS transporter|nr:Bcr/CflA family multidrug efflux MFS transporter [Pseudonocardiaceae bacterium]